MHIVDEYMKIGHFAAMKGNYSKKYLSVPLWDKSVTNNIYFFAVCNIKTYNLQAWSADTGAVVCLPKGLWNSTEECK